ncbi:hypothetical protein [Vibrio hippocampi]|uniref:Uncharacterized protein n=1 Tax=Vibrio hippocampi TaxID=654686 RepID=A0ABN8DFN6_9VIBR|nr:hypothetical protein [Vibrio hippocampi]CAH0526123.1 hypothetical protein VHP8226_01597 [Vibrio hippocampi]
MNAQLQSKIEELLVLAKSQGVSIVGLVDIPGNNVCHVFKSIEPDCKQGTRNLDNVMMRQLCTGDSDSCKTCHMGKSTVSENGLALLAAELNELS